MSEQPREGLPVASEVEASLHTIAQVLRAAQPVGPEARRALADLVDELGNVLHTAAVAPSDVRHLADSTTHLIQALHHRQDAGRLARARDRLEQAILSIESQAPVAAGLARRVLDALANLGI
jgi:hypothetical protein